MRARIIVGAYMVLVGCHEQVALPSLDLEGVRSMLVVQTDEGGTKVRGFDIEPDGLTPAWTLAGEADVHTVGYGCSLQRLGLQPGLQSQEVSEAEEDFLPQAYFEQRLRTGQEQWQMATERDAVVQEALRSLPLSRQTNCETWTAQLEPVDTSLPSDGHAGAAFMIGLGDGSALTASSNGYYYRVWASGQVEPLQRSWPQQPRAMHRQADGSLWLLDAEGDLYEGTVDGTFERVATGGPPLPEFGVAHMVGPEDAQGPMELFVATSSGTISHYDGASWRELLAPSEAPRDQPRLPRLLWRGPGHMLVSGHTSDVLEFKSGSLMRQRLSDGAAPVGINEVPGVGVLVGSRSGKIYVQQGTEWVLHGDPGIRQYTVLQKPLPGRGMLVGGLMQLFPARFTLSQWLPELGYCEPQDQPAVAVDTIALDEQTFLMVTLTNLFGNQSYNVAMRRVAQPPATCAPL